jgi:hypothetical protein
MQKISSYLYSNRILAIEDLSPFPVEYKIMYARTIKLYKGIRNVVEFDIRNADQKRLDLSAYNIKCVIMDQNSTEIITKSVSRISNTTGLAQAIIEPGDIEYLKPQFLKYSLYRETDGVKLPFYIDSSFNVIGKIDLLDGAVPKISAPKIIDTFIYMENDVYPNDFTRTYTSDSVEVNPRNDINDTHSISLEFRNSGLEATVTVQITDDVVVSTATTWTDLETFVIESTTERVFKVYSEIEDYSNNVNWLRITYEPIDESTGKFDKILVSA